MPLYFNDIGVIKLLWPNARFIYVRRDALDNCLLCYAKWFKNPHPYSNSLVTTTGYLRRHVAMMDHWNRIYPEDIHAVAYEDFVDDPQGSAMEILRFIGVSDLTPPIGFSSQNNLEYEGRPISGNKIGHARNYARHLSAIVADLPGAP